MNKKDPTLPSPPSTHPLATQSNYKTAASAVASSIWNDHHPFYSNKNVSLDRAAQYYNIKYQFSRFLQCNELQYVGFFE